MSAIKRYIIFSWKKSSLLRFAVLLGLMMMMLMMVERIAVDFVRDLAREKKIQIRFLIADKVFLMIAKERWWLFTALLNCFTNKKKCLLLTFKLRFSRTRLRKKKFFREQVFWLQMFWILKITRMKKWKWEDFHFISHCVIAIRGIISFHESTLN